MITRSILVFLIVGILLTAATPPMKGNEPLERALAWLGHQQQPDGGYSNGFSSGSDVGTTADVVLAVALAGQVSSFWGDGAPHPGDYLEAQVAAGSVRGPGLSAKVAMATLALGLEPREFGGVDLLSAVRDGYDSSLGLFGGGTFDSALCVLGLSLAGEPLPEGALQGILATRLDDGSYAFNGDTTPGGGDSNTTALVVQALVVAGSAGEIAPSLEYFRRAQNPDGGWTYQKPSAYGEETDANSTALAIQALLAAGENLEDWGNPMSALLALQQDNGAFTFNASTPGDSMIATAQAIPALAGADYSGVRRMAAGAAVGERPTTIAISVIVVTAVVLTIVGLASRRRT